MNANRREQIIHMAANLFLDRGYTAVTMRDLAQELGIKASSLYNHISSKEEILSAIVMGLAEEFSRHIEQVAQEDWGSVAKMEALIAMHVDTTLDKTSALACMNREWKFLDPDSRKRYLELRNAYEAQFLAIVQQGMRQGELKRRDPHIFSYSTLSVLRTLYHWYNKEEGFSKEKIKEGLVQNLLLGIVERPLL